MRSLRIHIIPGVLVLALATALAACSDDSSGVAVSSRRAVGTSSISKGSSSGGLSGGVGNGSGGTSSGPGTPGGGGQVQSVTISPANPVVYLPAASGPSALPTTVSLSASVFLSTGLTATAVLWTTSNPAVATVDANGLVAAVNAGTVTITATSKQDPSKATSVQVPVQSAGNLSLTVN